MDARERIRAAYDPRLIEAAGHKLADLLASHMRRVQGSESVVLNWADPRAYIAEASQIADSHAMQALDVSSGARSTSSDALSASAASVDVLARRFAELCAT